MDKQTNNRIAIQSLRKFRIIFGSVRQHFREIERTCGVTGSQLWMLQEVSNNPGIGISELAERLSIHQSTCSQLIDKLAVRSLISKKRSEKDQRRVGLCLTPEAETILNNAPEPAEGILPEALKALPESALLELDAALHEVINQLHLRDEKLGGSPLSEL